MKRSHSIVSLVLLVVLGRPQTAIAQVSADGTVGSIVSTGPLFTITGGSRPSNGPNLFHSFSQFSLPTGSSAIFQNDPAVQTIFSRVTGGSRSDINGTIQTQGNASLFLMNPNGILFGPNAKLELGGSFVGTTANRIKFEDGIEFGAANLTNNPLLTVKVPIGLQMGTNSGNIQVTGNGHQLLGGALTPVIRNDTLPTLEVKSGQSIALVGQNVTLSGGVLTAENGRVELGAVKIGTVDFNSTSSELQLGYKNIDSFGDIQLANKSLIDTSGLTSNGIQLQGQNIRFTDGSGALIQTVGSQVPNRIHVRATGLLDLSGDVRVAPDLGIVTGVIASRLLTENLGNGKGAGIDIAAGDLRLNDGGLVGARTYGAGNGGNINVNIARDLHINRVTPLNPVAASGVATTSFSPGQAGIINITASNLTITDGGVINSSSFGEGNSGSVNLNVSSNIEVKGIDLPTLTPTNIASNALGKGNSGSLTVTTSRLIVANAAGVGGSTFNSGHGGKVTLNASESVEVRDMGRINASAPILPAILRQILQLPDRPSGDGGSITINTPTLKIESGGLVTVNNEGSGNGGTLTINANSFRLNNNGQIISNTASGEGGDIYLNLKSDVILRNNSFISTDAQGNGNGGSLIISSPIIVGLENSDLIANAKGGRGGNINITTQDLLGLAFRNTLIPRTDVTNDITASSESSLNGNIRINTIGINPNNGLTSLPMDLKDSSRQMNDRCSNSKTNSFVSTGRGGIPKNPVQINRAGRTWNDLRNTEHDRSPITTAITTPIAQSPIIEASAFKTNLDGSIELITPRASAIDSGETCALQ